MDQSKLHPHLRDDAPQKQCNKCGRKTVDMKEIKCRMTQPDGSTCTGSFRKENNDLTTENTRLLKRVDDLEQAIGNGMNDAARMVDRNGWLESEHERLKQANKALSEALLAAQAECQAHQEYAYPKIEQLEAENARLRGLLREIVEAASRDEFGSIGVELLGRIKAELGSE